MGARFVFVPCWGFAYTYPVDEEMADLQVLASFEPLQFFLSFAGLFHSGQFARFSFRNGCCRLQAGFFFLALSLEEIHWSERPESF